MGLRRSIGVILPFALAIAATIFVLVPTLAGVTDKSLYVFKVNFENLSISPVSDLIDKIDTRSEISNKNNRHIRAKAVDKNITAGLLGLEKTYDTTLWGYCHTDKDNKRECSRPAFNWVRKNVSMDSFKSADRNIEIKLPKEITEAIETFGSLTKAAEVAFIVALLELAIQIALGVFAICSRELTCWTWIISGFASAFTLASAILSTIMASFAVGVVETTAKLYGVRVEINTVFLAIIWIGAAFAIVANLLWILPTLCCVPKQRSSEDSKSLLTGSRHGAYVPVHDDHEMHSMYRTGGLTPSSSEHTRADHAYEPYSHHV
ncbi:SUR7/PalI family-domain-containing protein [Fusarium flagelliforme]|uniref:SUR7/PalI family-domain-containing protein n=1 Tax=Fusarium flagelliforme TaxID=2675880 RepID=UPI001E8DAB3B|nr:SUR7/PalI family-domain-containing protein [Fusarium flagelliforme]KAH7185090.1 SUR7/PalI family-domain-containing protein [Fusarium flagelliforme]